MLDKFLPEAQKLVLNLNLSAVEGSTYGFTYKVSNITIRKFELERPVVTFVKGEGLDVHLPSVSVSLKLRYSVTGTDWWNPLYSSGTVTAVVARRSQGSGLLRVGVTPSGSPHLNFTLGNLHVGLKKLTLHGTAFSGLANVMTDVFKDYIEDVLSAQVGATLEDFLNVEMNSYMDAVDLRFPLPLPEQYNISAADLRLCGVHTSPAAMVVDISGAIVDPSKPYLEYPEAPLTLPRGPPMSEEKFESHMIVMMLTKWTINSGLWLYKESDRLRAEIFQKDLPDSSPVVLSANALKPLIMNNPDVPRWWWKDDQEGKSRQFELVLQGHGLPSVDFADGLISIQADTSIGFKLLGVETADLYAARIRAPLSTKVNLTIDKDHTPQRIHCNINYVSALPISIEGSQQSVNLWAASAFIQLLSQSVLIPMANDAFADIELPSAMGISLVNSSLNVTKALMFATDMEINASKVMDIAYYGAGSKEEATADSWDDWGNDDDW